MRLYQKRQTLELLSTIDEGIDYASGCGEDKAIGMLQECNNGLTFLSNFISEEKVVHELLEKVTAVVNDTVFCLLSESQDDLLFENYLIEIKNKLNDIRNTLIDEVKTEIEIVFMPYKISMWDSLESIYKEAATDPNCSCYVVPIPYYEKNAQGQIISSCYEGDQFPNDLNLMAYDAYDFENRRPDIIYIHNPYDKYNTLTMVNPRFFSDNLARYTDMLVYVPYYVAGSLEKATILAYPSLMNVTKIIAQSNNDQNGYIKNGIQANKVLNLGSPKIDAALATVKHHKELPLYWKEVIQNKKVFLFNTGIADLLAINTWFEQLEQVFNFFINHEQYVLIWRPHPLTEITLKTMRPYLYGSFVKIGDQLKQAANIIIDNSSDVYTAIATSDGIISDYSSVLLQSIITEKPVLGVLSEQLISQDRYYYADYLGCYFLKDVTIDKFVSIVVSNDDYKKEERISRFKSSISNADGTSGQKIHHSIKGEVMDYLMGYLTPVSVER